MSRATLAHTLNEWCVMTGRDSRTILAGLRRADLPTPGPGEKIPFKSIEAALFGEDYVEKVRGLKLDNDAKEREKLIEEGNLIALPELEQWLTEHVILPLTSAFAQMPNELAPLLYGADRDKIAAIVADHIENKIKPPMRERLKSK